MFNYLLSSEKEKERKVSQIYSFKIGKILQKLKYKGVGENIMSIDTGFCKIFYLR